MTQSLPVDQNLGHENLSPRLPEGAVASRDPAAVRAVMPAGPWTHEPDRVEWRAHGFPCLIVRHAESWHLCGYVGVEPGHPWHGVSLVDAEWVEGGHPKVHGGITYSAECAGHICHVARPGEPEHVWWHGFDACHAFDLSPFDLTRPGYGRLRASRRPEEYRTIEYMVAEAEKLARQAAALRVTP